MQKRFALWTRCRPMSLLVASPFLIVPPLGSEAVIELRVKVDPLICAGTNDTSDLHGTSKTIGNPPAQKKSKKMSSSPTKGSAFFHFDMALSRKQKKKEYDRIWHQLGDLPSDPLIVVSQMVGLGHWVYHIIN